MLLEFGYPTSCLPTDEEKSKQQNSLFGSGNTYIAPFEDNYLL
jgi:hypothetical protein